MLKKTATFLLSMIMASGCSNPGKDYFGTWSNKIDGRGDIDLVIWQDGEHILVKEMIESTGQVLSTHSAHLPEGYLIIDNNVLFSKLVFSEQDKQLHVLGNSNLPLPSFHKIK